MAEIICRNIRKKYGEVLVVPDFNLTVADQEFVVFLGPSGCGKSTMLRMMAGLESITDGELAIGDQIVNNLEPRDRGIAMVFQNYALYPHMTIRDNIAFGLRRIKVSEKEIADRTEEVTQVLGLQPYLDRKPTELSGGQQQRVAIARAMIKTPKVFLFDEPLSNLDAKLRATMREEIARLHRKLRTTTVYVTHDQMEAMTLADRIVLMKDGKIEQVGTPEEIYEKPRTFFVAGFIGTPAMNFLELTLKDGVLIGDDVELDLNLSRFDLREGQKVILGVRPANLNLVTGDGPQVLTGVTDLTEYHGDKVIISYDVGPNRIHASVPAREKPAEGETVSFALDEAEIHLFDMESGLSLLSAQK